MKTTSGIRVLLVGQPFALPYEVHHIEGSERLLEALATFDPDVIVTSTYVPGVLRNLSFEIRKRWIDVNPKSTGEEVAGAVESAYRSRLWSAHGAQARHPLVSVYTGTYNTGDYLEDAYRSVADQTWPDWEWVVVDDHSDDGTWERLEAIAARDPRVRVFRSGSRLRRVGAVKDLATRLAKGDILVELDHDDMLTDFALDEIRKAFMADLEAGMVYSNCAAFFENGSPHMFTDGFWSTRYRDTEYHGKVWKECVQPDIHGRFGPHYTQQFAYTLTHGPHHVRAFRARTLFELGGYNPRLPIVDDFDLYARFFLSSKCVRIDRMCYLYRVRDNWSNTWFRKGSSIQDHLAHARGQYDAEFQKANERPAAGNPDGTARAPEASTPQIPAPPPVGEPTKPFATYDISYVVPEAVPTFFTTKCLESIREWSPRSEIILVANGCEPLPETLALADKVVRLEENVRFSAGSNEGARHATRPILCFMNNDAEFVDDTPVRMVGQIKAPHLIVGPYSNYAKPPQGNHPESVRPAGNLELDMVVGLCMMIPRQPFLASGGFDPRLDTWDDDDLCLRFRRMGCRPLVVGGTYVRHEGHYTFKALGEDVQKVIAKSAAIYAEKHPVIRVIAIAKDEEKAVEGYFRQFEPITKDWALLDTGSSDRTVDIAARMGVKIEQTEMTDFAQARNMALHMFAQGATWVIMLDPDERLDQATIARLEQLLHHTDIDVFLAPLEAIHPDGARRLWVPKPFIFRTNGCHWVFKVHEKLVGSTAQALVTNAKIEHRLELHDDGRRQKAEGFYQTLMDQEPYFNNPAYRQMMREKWPILDYDHTDDPRIRKVQMGPLVSVIVPTYKRPHYLRIAVASALAQDYANLEVVVVSDGDPEFTPPFAENPRVRSYNLKANHGAGGAVPRNQGILRAAGQYIAYLDDDNHWEPGHVSGLMSRLVRTGADFAFSSMKVDDRNLIFEEPKLGGIDTSCIIHRRTLIDRHGGWKDRSEGGYPHDWEIVSRWLAGGAKWEATMAPTLIYNAETSGQKEFIRSLAATGRA